MLTKEHTKTWTVKGEDGREHTVEASISPCSWMYPGYGLQIRVSVDGDTSNGGSDFRNLKGKEWDALTEADFDALCAEPLVLDPCPTPGCDGVRIRGSRDTDPKSVAESMAVHGIKLTKKKAQEDADAARLCEKCYLDRLNSEVKKSQAKRAKKDQLRDAKARAEGFTHKVEAWVHPEGGGDDYRMVAFTKGAPSKKWIENSLKKEGSRVLTDYRITALPVEAEA